MYSPKEHLLPFRGWVVLQDRRDSGSQYDQWHCISPASFALAVEKGSVQSSVSNLEKRNSLSRCAKCICVAVVPLTHRFSCFRAVLRVFNQLSSNTIIVHSQDGNNLHSVKVVSGLTIPSQKHDLMLNECWYLKFRPKLWVPEKEAPNDRKQ